MADNTEPNNYYDPQYPTDPYQGSSSGYSPYLPAKTEEQHVSLINELDPRKHLQHMINELAGKIWDNETAKFVLIEEDAKPFMNATGRMRFYQFATAALNQVLTMSNYAGDYDTINGLTLMIIRRAVHHFHLHWKDYGIEKKTDVGIIGDKLMFLVLSALYKAIGAGERKAATSNITESISTSFKPNVDHAQPEKRRGIFGRMLG